MNEEIEQMKAELAGITKQRDELAKQLAKSLEIIRDNKKRK